MREEGYYLVRDMQVNCCHVTASFGLGFAMHAVYFQA